MHFMQDSRTFGVCRQFGDRHLCVKHQISNNDWAKDQMRQWQSFKLQTGEVEAFDVDARCAWPSEHKATASSTQAIEVTPASHCCSVDRRYLSAKTGVTLRKTAIVPQTLDIPIIDSEQLPDISHLIQPQQVVCWGTGSLSLQCCEVERVV